MKYYAGIGSRETPSGLRARIKLLVDKLNGLNYTLRSGGAPGADSFFEDYSKRSEIYLPWRRFNENSSPLFNITKEAIEMAKRFHPSPDRLSNGALLLMARNCYQVLGQDLKTPCEFILCWTKDGKASGGTGQAIRIAKYYNIPIVNLFYENHYTLMLRKLESYEKDSNG